MRDTLQNTIDHAVEKLGSEKLFGGLKIAFNDVSFRLGVHSHPAIDFAQENDMSCILGGYELPEGVDVDLLQDFAMCALFLARSGNLPQETYQNLLEQVWSGICGLNAVLNDIDLDASYYQSPYYTPLYHAIMGVGDEFNPSDIQFFLKDLPNALNDSRYKDSTKDIEAVCGTMFWRPSPETISNVRGILHRRR